MGERASIVLDMGTTNCKISLYQISSFKLIAQERFCTPKIKCGDYTDYASEKLWRNIQNKIKKFSKMALGNIDKIIISSVGEMGVIIDAAGSCRGPMIAWNDPRGAEYIAGLSSADKRTIHEISGLPPHSNYSVAKIKWLEKHYIESWEKGMCWLNLPNYIAFLLTGVKQMEYTLASRTMALDLRAGKWSEKLMNLFGLPKEIFPPIVQGKDRECRISPHMASDLELPLNTKVLVTGHDHMSGSVAVGLKEGELLNSTGTTEGILCVKTAYPIGDTEIKAKLAGGRYIFPNKFTVYGSLPAAGLSFERFQKLHFYSSDEFDAAVDTLYEEYVSGQTDLTALPLFIPHLNGSGSPDKRPEAKGMFYGVCDKTTDRDILCAVAMGLCMELRQLKSFFEESGKEKKVLRVIGPAVKNKLWLQLKADVLNMEVAAIDIPEAVSYGAMLEAYPHMRADTENTAVSRIFPDSERAEILNKIYRKYKKLYDMKLQFEHECMECS